MLSNQVGSFLLPWCCMPCVSPSLQCQCACSARIEDVTHVGQIILKDVCWSEEDLAIGSTLSPVIEVAAACAI